MKIHKLLGVVLFLMIPFQMFAQLDDEREKLRVRVEETNKVLPVSAMKGLVFAKKYISELSVYEVHEVDEVYISFSALKRKKGLMKKNLLKKYAEDPNLYSFAKLVVDCNMDIVIQYVSKQSGDTFQIILKTKDLAQLRN